MLEWSGIQNHRCLQTSAPSGLYEWGETQAKRLSIAFGLSQSGISSDKSSGRGIVHLVLIKKRRRISSENSEFQLTRSPYFGTIRPTEVGSLGDRLTLTPAEF
jgi:hypothetical protein